MYSIDTSSIVAAHSEWYSPEQFPCFWVKFNVFLKSGLVVAHETVKEELDKLDPNLFKTIGGKRHPLFQKMDEGIQKHAREVLKRYESLTKEGTGGHADPWVVALAKQRSLTVVSEEAPDPRRKHQNIKIPDVCAAFSIPCINLRTLVKRQEWIFP